MRSPVPRFVCLLALVVALPAVTPTNAATAAGRDDANGAAQRAAKLLRACNGGDAAGCYDLAVDYDAGDGVAKDEARAASLYAKGCDGGDA